MNIKLIDTHCHLDSDAFDPDRSECIERARSAGLKAFIVIGATDGWDSAERMHEFCAREPDFFYSVGIHPLYAKTELNRDKLYQLAKGDKCVAIGETGLDYHWNATTKAEQYQWFEIQAEIALELNKPIVIHCRKAFSDCIEFIDSYLARGLKAVFHCFSEGPNEARALRERDCYVSFTGVLTFKNAETLREAFLASDIERVMTETDCPYLAPVPFRGQRAEPAHVAQVLSEMARLKKMSLEQISEQVFNNAVNFFSLKEYGLKV